MKLFFFKNTIVINLVLLVLSFSTLRCVSPAKDHSGSAKALIEKDSLRLFYLNGLSALGPDDERKPWLALRKSQKDLKTIYAATMLAGEFDAAEVEVRSYLEKNPKDQEALKALVFCLIMNKKVNQAYFYIEQIEGWFGPQSDLSNAKGIYFISRASRRDSFLERAVEMFDLAYRSSTDEVAGGLNLGFLKLELGDSAGAKNLFEEVKGRCENCIPAVLGLGIAQFRLKEFESARENFSSLVSRDPNHGQALYRLALISNNVDKNPEQAKKYIDQIRLSSTVDEVIKKRAEGLLLLLQEEDRNKEIEK